MKPVNLRPLEIHTESLIKTCERLKQENQYLMEKQAHLLRERNELLEKNRLAVEKINHIIARLTELEHPHE